MKPRMSRIASVALAIGMVALLLLMASGPALAQKTTTAQSAMFNNTASGNFVITGTEVWVYNTTTAATFFTNTETSGPDISCTGGGRDGVNCAASNQPATPTAPDPNPNKLTPHISSNSCNFWDGTALSLSTGPATTYTQSVTVNGLNGNGNWKFEWTYTIDFASGGSGPFSAQTAWDLQSSDTTNAEVMVTGFFAGESTQKKASSPRNPWTFKTSFTMTDDLGASRLVNPVAHILNSGADEICTLTINTVLDTVGADYFYAQNAGNNGPTGQLVDNGHVLDIETGDVGAPGNDGTLGTTDDLFDDFTGNNATLGQKADITSTDPASCSIEQAGNYTLNVTGTLKGVSGAASLPVSVTSTLCISAGTCQVCP